MKIGNREFDTDGHTYIMGILNVTPDSFSDGGKFNNVDAALMHTAKMINEGADIIDVGGESTRPGYTMISDDEEIERVVPVIERIKGEFDIPISIDTYKSGVAKEALKAGAHLVNDIWGLKYDENMASVIAEYNACCCLMHNRNVKEKPYQNLLIDVLSDLQESIQIAHHAGINDDSIIIDPGIGFAKDLSMNLKVMNNLELLIALGFPVLLAASRKSMIGLTLGLPSDERVEGTVATTVIGIMKGCSFVRVHDIKENKQAIRMAEAILHV